MVHVWLETSKVVVVVAVAVTVMRLRSLYVIPLLMKMLVLRILFIISYILLHSESQILHSVSRMDTALQNQATLSQHLYDYLQLEHKRLHQLDLWVVNAMFEFIYRVYACYLCIMSVQLSSSVSITFGFFQLIQLLLCVIIIGGQQHLPRLLSHRRCSRV